ncbi:SpoIVB peptidase [Ruminococcus sp.]|uniref:SpoIVB peptidase n=1 Tax=Ruminococcus sp. TaxID=41978 RepID=UPI003F09DB4D
MKKFKKILSVALSGAILLGLSQITAVSETESQSVYLGGQPFGVKFYNNGVVVINLESYFDGNKYVCPAKEGGLKVNDVIKEVNGETICTNEALQEASVNSNGETLTLIIERDGKELCKNISPKKNTAGMYLIGAWVRDSCAGIGTITYYDTNNNYFAALGHGICDNDTSLLLPLGSGEAVHANINGVTKSSFGKAGSLNGYFTDSTIGYLIKNTEVGVYGTISDNFSNKERKIKIAENSDIKTENAELYTTIEGEEPQYYSIEITKIVNLNSDCNENFVIKITDEKLLKYCGGIVQGMSGSPIIQNGKLVGAVTHVFLNNPSEGYGITAQNMVTNYDE